jgi:hypothetical protein
MVACAAGSAPLQYTLTAKLDAASRTLSGRAMVALANTGPDTVRSVDLALGTASRCYRRRSVVSAIDRIGRIGQARDILASRIELEPGGLPFALHGDDAETATVSLARPAAPGDTVLLDLGYRLGLAGASDLESGIELLYVLADWYPRVCALNTGPPPARVDFVAEIEAPDGLAVAGSGGIGGWAGAENWLALDPLARVGHGNLTWRLAASNLPSFAFVAVPRLVTFPDATLGSRVRILCEPERLTTWSGLAPAAESAAAALTSTYGPPPVPSIAVVDVASFADLDTTLPGLVLIGRPGVAFTRIREARLYRQLALQWFNVVVTPDPVTGAWLRDGPAVLAEVHQMAARRDRADFLALPFRLWLLDEFSTEYFHRLMYYSAATNELLEPLGRPPRRFADNTVNVAEARYSQAGLFWLGLERRLGPERLEATLRDYLSAGPGYDSLVAACRRQTGADLAGVISPWLDRRGICDYTVSRGRGGVRVRRLGALAPPVELELAYADGTSERHTLTGFGRDTTIALRHGTRLRRATLDPDRLLLEPDRWNNHWPRRVKVLPIVALPDFDAYQVFYGPYAWWDTYHGIRYGGWLQGRQFIDAGPLRGRHMWSVAETYSAGLDKWQTGFSYQTPLLTATRELRFRALGKYAVLESDALVGLEYGLSPVFRRSGSLIRLEYQWLSLDSTRGRDTRGWEEARTSELRFTNNYTRRTDYSATDGLFYLGKGINGLGGGYDYWKVSLDVRQAVRVAGPLGLYARAFAGGIWGSIPRQGLFYLSGGLIPTEAEPVNLGHEGWASPQALWHFESDANVRAYSGWFDGDGGFEGGFEQGRFAYGGTVMLTLFRYFGVFYDIGNVGDDLDRELARVRMDAGIRFRLGPLYADVPLWRWQVGSAAELCPRVMLGLNLAGLGDF